MHLHTDDNLDLLLEVHAVVETATALLATRLLRDDLALQMVVPLGLIICIASGILY